MNSLYALSPKEIEEKLRLEKSFQAKIIYKFLTNGITSFSEMSSLPLSLRERLTKEYGSALSSKVIEKKESNDAVKLAIELSDGLVIECVRLFDGKSRYTACLSSQVGCAMGCKFCKTGTMGLYRNLKKEEIVEEFVHLSKLGERISHIVFMGMGEPMANFTEVLEAIQYLHNEDGYNISYRKITISTCGLVSGIRKLTEVNIPVKLAVSLVSSHDETRSELMPVNNRFPLSELKKALLSFQHKEGKRITLEYCLLSSVNTSEESAEELFFFLKGLDALINIIPWNEVEGLPFKSPDKREIQTFLSYLDKRNIKYTVRRRKGDDDSAACGQLASGHKMGQK